MAFSTRRMADRQQHLSTPAEVSATLRRCWEVAVTSERIVCDIRRWTAAIDAIIKAEGAKVPELDNRRGRRATRVLAVQDDAKGALAALCTRNGTSTESD